MGVRPYNAPGWKSKRVCDALPFGNPLSLSSLAFPAGWAAMLAPFRTDPESKQRVVITTLSPGCTLRKPKQLGGGQPLVSPNLWAIPDHNALRRAGSAH